MDDRSFKMALAAKQLEIDKLKRIIKEYENGQRDTKDRKEDQGSEQNNSSD